ncbi:hypothetical protein AVEN_77082-1 [Araneus ventricosus]|uniref:Uncharacterized protein n=1 Tax=Araneus ventricosus TaxID=182803 RepID=A0A4Y2PPZ0_ARAVE|nr:hypothetical protein AVEN_77082-1 [Araneus ventricosus]
MDYILKDFWNYQITKFDNAVKPVVVLVVDGDPDENPRYQKTIQVGVHHFRQNNLDALFIAANSPGRSAFNRIERRIAPLSRVARTHFAS